MAFKKTDVAQTESPIAEMKRIMALESSIEVRQPDDISDQIIERILTAETVEEIFAAAESGLETAESMFNLPVQLLSIVYNKSNFEDGLPVYSVVTAVDANGVKHVFGCGGKSAQAQLFKWNQGGHFPLVAVLVEKQTSNNAVRLFRAPQADELKPFVG